MNSRPGGRPAAENRTKEERVAEFLREGIISGRIARGVRLKQQEIADLLRTSITPVREALKLLEAEGYLVGDSYRGVVVAAFDPEASTEILRLRITLEAQLVGGAVARITADNIDHLRMLSRAFEVADAANENVEARAANYRLHRYLYEIAEMPQTLHFVEVLWARYPFDKINQVPGRVSRAAAEHAQLIECIIGGDEAGAMLTMRRHIESGWSELRTATKVS